MNAPIQINFQPSRPYRVVVLHAWEPNGRIWHLESRLAHGAFPFTIAGSVCDPRLIKFKFRFPDDACWEPDELIRAIPSATTTLVTAFEDSTRVLDGAAAAAPTAAPVTVVHHGADGRTAATLSLWNPASGYRESIASAGRDARGATSFRIPLSAETAAGFHFAFAAADGTPEEPAAARVWNPADPSVVHALDDRADVLAAAPVHLAAQVTLIYPSSLAGPPAARLADNSQNLIGTIEAEASVPYAADPRFREATYTLSVTAGLTYLVEFAGSASPPAQHRFVPLTLSAGAPPTLSLVYGADNWFTGALTFAAVRVVMVSDETMGVSRLQGPRPQAFSVQLGVAANAAFDTVAATAFPDQTWIANVTVPCGVYVFAAPSGAANFDARPDGPISGRRWFTISAPAASSTDVISAEGIGGCITRQTPPAQRVASPYVPSIREPPVARKLLMESMFGAPIVNAGVFDPEELPQGPTRSGNDVYVVVAAPDAMTLELILLSNQNVRSSVPMCLTPDKRYWWCSVPAASMAHGQRYRVLQNGDVELLDPAARWADDPSQNLMTSVGDGIDAAWSLYCDQGVIDAIQAGDRWKTLPWEAMIIYKLHGGRFTIRNANQAPGFDQVGAELASGGYLAGLAVTELEFMPLAEFNVGTWGYNPSLYFAVESRYGGPEALARCGVAAHRVGKGLFMDVVFNHYFQSPLENLAPDVYIDGRTSWGNMVNFDNGICMRFFRQTLVYLWNRYRLDGFRFDCTLAMMVETGVWDGVVIVPGSGGGHVFLSYLRAAVRKAADAIGQPWPYLDGENEPNMWDMTNPEGPNVLDGQWNFDECGALQAAVTNSGDQSHGILTGLGEMIAFGRPFYESVRFAESQDTCGHNAGIGPPHDRLVHRAPYGQGFQMSKAVAAVVLLANGVPMLFMGQEAGEDIDFYFEITGMQPTQPGVYLRLDLYETSGADQNKILTWFRDLAGLRNDRSTGLGGDDWELRGSGAQTVAFTRAGGRFFVVATFGTPNSRQTLSWLGLPGGRSYKEIFNSTWPQYNVVFEGQYLNGGYDATLDSDSIVNLPPIGAVVFESL